MKKIISLLVFSFLLSCTKEKIDLPPLLENVLPSSSEMTFNLLLSENKFPDKIKKFYQVQNQDTVNILEFDKNKNLIFKYYKQYVSENWNGRFIYMIEANVYNDNKLIKTYYLHSNIEYELFEYSYSGDNITELKSTILGYLKDYNTNPHLFIKEIKNYKDCIDFVKKIESENKKRPNYIIKREFWNNEIKEYSNFNTTKYDGSYKLYILNKNNKIQKIEYYVKGKKWDSNAKYFEYDSSNNLKKTYSIDQKDTLRSTEYRYKNLSKIIIRKESNIEISRKEFLKNTLIKNTYQAVDSSYYGTENFFLDKFGIPVKTTQKDQEIDTCYNFKNYYEFYK
ncbi:hypothetical protein [Flavobacterium reichenbachii]|uniref:Lipoprotein n=1 Tax=Flavobacterium reichenbachii TaxID=362418 RepID=A0A085ZN24_9FLAO|nr:hypothetical protein [Flavobacterium reichenbachii]KFF05838.1 hypothetical protein IW19_10025 [Flavobacterium reichenbachii]OXB12723.1 hypothetical protein B0A68_18215 [Flavobacterium reichenbachii]